jgi:hypothetical protein
MHAKRLALILVGVFITAAALAPSAWAAPVTGAGFTTVNQIVDGTGHCKNGNPNINCNIYDGKQYVWLNGGPSVAYVGDGDYFFAVLVPGGQNDPNDAGANNLSDTYCAPYTNCPGPTNGDSTLIPTGDSYTNRKFHVTGGTITNVYGSTHQFANNKIRLMPYDDTTNPGGVYILAICSLPIGSSPPVNASSCKYDAFKVQESECQGDNCNPSTANKVSACKYYDSNADGSQNGSESGLQGWPMTINPSDTAVEGATQFTDSRGCILWTGLADDLYTVTEGAPTETNWYNSQPGPNPTFLVAPTGPSQSVEVSGGEQGVLDFWNFCTGAGNGLTKGWWSNTNGYTDLSNGSGGVNGALSPFLVGLNLKDSLGGTQPNGNDFDPTCYCTQGNCPPNVNPDCPAANSQALRTWLVNASAKSMAYMLSVQLATMELNVRQTHVTGGSLVLAGLPPAGCIVPGLTAAGVISIADLMKAANNQYTPATPAISGSNHSLYQDPLTVASGVARSCQEYMKNALDNANNNLNFIEQTACQATFPQ